MRVIIKILVLCFVLNISLFGNPIHTNTTNTINQVNMYVASQTKKEVKKIESSFTKEQHEKALKETIIFSLILFSTVGLYIGLKILMRKKNENIKEIEKLVKVGTYVK